MDDLELNTAYDLLHTFKGVESYLVNEKGHIILLDDTVFKSLLEVEAYCKDT